MNTIRIRKSTAPKNPIGSERGYARPNVRPNVKLRDFLHASRTDPYPLLERYVFVEVNVRPDMKTKCKLALFKIFGLL